MLKLSHSKQYLGMLLIIYFVISTGSFETFCFETFNEGYKKNINKFRKLNYINMCKININILKQNNTIFWRAKRKRKKKSATYTINHI